MLFDLKTFTTYTCKATENHSKTHARSKKRPTTYVCIKASKKTVLKVYFSRKKKQNAQSHPTGTTTPLNSKHNYIKSYIKI